MEIFFSSLPGFSEVCVCVCERARVRMCDGVFVFVYVCVGGGEELLSHLQ